MRSILIAAMLVVGCGSNSERSAARDAKAKNDAALQESADAEAKRKADAEAKVEAIRNDPSKLEGKWELTSANTDGRDWAKGRLSGWYYVFKDGHVTNIVDGRAGQTEAFNLDPSKTPAHIDMPGDHNPKKPKTQEGLYKLDGDTLAICTALDFKRPTELRTGRGVTLMTLKRVK